MGQGLSSSCGELSAGRNGSGLSAAVRNGELDMVMSILESDPSSKLRLFNGGHGRLSPLHLAASTGQIEILSLLLDRGANPDSLCRHKQTPLMLAAMHGKISCLEKLIEVGASMLIFDSIQGRTCLHYAALHGNSECLEALLSSAHSSPVAASWGYARFVNIRDKNGSTPLHLAARQRQADCVHILLDKGALVCATTGGFGYCGSTPLHLAARGGSLDCVRELLARGADRLQRDSAGRTAYMVALKYKHMACAALLNPSSPEPLVWPSTLKFINELNSEAKALLEKALIEANKRREKSILKEASNSLLPSVDNNAVEDGSSEVELQKVGISQGLSSASLKPGVSSATTSLSFWTGESESELCCICFEQACTIQVQECGHQMCAPCTLVLCCQTTKPSHHHHPPAATKKPPLCPFCRTTITQLVVATPTQPDPDNDTTTIDGECDEDDGGVEMSPSKPRRSRKYWSYSEGSSSFKGLSSLGKMVGRKIAAGEEMDKNAADLQQVMA